MFMLGISRFICDNSMKHDKLFRLFLISCHRKKSQTHAVVDHVYAFFL